MAEAEKARNDSDFGVPVEAVSRVGAGKHSRFPLKSIEHKGDQYVVGMIAPIIPGRFSQ